jgi:hypothetical protein
MLSSVEIRIHDNYTVVVNLSDLTAKFNTDCKVSVSRCPGNIAEISIPSRIPIDSNSLIINSSLLFSTLNRYYHSPRVAFMCSHFQIGILTRFNSKISHKYLMKSHHCSTSPTSFKTLTNLKELEIRLADCLVNDRDMIKHITDLQNPLKFSIDTLCSLLPSVVKDRKFSSHSSHNRNELDETLQKWNLFTIPEINLIMEFVQNHMMKSYIPSFIFLISIKQLALNTEWGYEWNEKARNKFPDMSFMLMYYLLRLHTLFKRLTNISANSLINSLGCLLQEKVGDWIPKIRDHLMCRSVGSHHSLCLILMSNLLLLIRVTIVITRYVFVLANQPSYADYVEMSKNDIINYKIADSQHYVDYQVNDDFTLVNSNIREYLEYIKQLLNWFIENNHAHPFMM